MVHTNADWGHKRQRGAQMKILIVFELEVKEHITIGEFASDIMPAADHFKRSVSHLGKCRMAKVKALISKSPIH